MKFELEVEFADGTVKTANVDGRDIRKWESESKSSIGDEDFGSFTSMCELARFTLIRQGDYSGTWAEFDATCVGVEEVKSESVDPTSKGRGGGKSSRSRS